MPAGTMVWYIAVVYCQLQFQFTMKERHLADIVVAAPMHLYPYQKLPLNDHPKLLRWMTEGIEQLPCWKGDRCSNNARAPARLMSAPVLDEH
jgi:hypothetical protein